MIQIEKLEAAKKGYFVYIKPDALSSFHRSFSLSNALWLLSLDMNDRDQLLAELEAYHLQIMKGEFKGV